MKKRKKRLLCVLGLITFIGAAGYIWQDKNKGDISAHPTQTITVKGSTPSLDFSIPKDGGSLFEPELLTVPNLSGFTQSEKIGGNLSKEVIHGYSTIARDSIAASLKLSNGNIIQGIHSYRYSATQVPAISTSKLQIVNPNGDVEKETWANGIPTWNKDSVVDGSQFAVTNFIESNGVITAFHASNFAQYDLNLNFIRRGTIDTNGFSIDGQVVNRFSSAFDGKFYHYAYVRPNSIVTNYINTFELDPIELSYSSKTSLKALNDIPQYSYSDRLSEFGQTLPSDWVEQIDLGSLERGINNKYVGINTYTNLAGGRATFSFINVWDEDGNLEYTYESPTSQKKVTTLKYIQKLSNEDEYYFMEYPSDEEPKLKMLNISTHEVQTLQVFPQGTNLIFDRTDNNKNILFAGYVESFTGVFQGYASQPSVVVGKLNEQYKPIFVTSLESDVRITVNQLIALNSEDYYLGGQLYGEGFVDDVPPSADIPDGWVNKLDDGLANAYHGIFNLKQDYSPVIDTGDNLDVNMDDDNILDKEKLDNLLLTGNYEGNRNGSSTEVQVFDNFDLNYSLSNYDQEWLNKRINRNPFEMSLPIDWETLGLDLTKAGSNLVTYFITDSQLQATSASKIVNVITNETVKNKKGALDAHNFAINVSDVKKLTNDSLRSSESYAKLTAWDLESGEDILSLPSDQGVEIDPTQLEAIRNATEFGVFDLTFKLNYGDEPKQITVKVFVSEDIEGDYAYKNVETEIPWDISRSITEQDYPTSEYAKLTVYKISTGEKIDKDNANYQLRGDVTELNAADPNPADHTATKVVKVPISVWTKGNTPTKEVTLSKTPDTTVYYRVEDVKIAFTDWNFGTLYDVDGNTLQAAGVELKNQIVGKTTAIKTNQEVLDAIHTISLKGYEKENFYLSDKQTELTVDGLEIVFNEGQGYHYYLRFKGLLELVSVPSKIDFGQGESTVGMMRKNDPTVTGNLVISDTRADTTKNWTLKAELTSPLTSLSGNTVIPDAIRYKRSGQAEFILDANKQVMLANNAGTFGTFNVSDTWGTGKDDAGFKFEAQAVKVHEIGTYQATIKYTLSDTYEP